MRILILTPEYSGSGGGIITFYRALAPALVRAGCEVHVIEGSGANSGPSSDSSSMDGVTVERLALDRLKTWSGRFARYTALSGPRQHLAAAWALWEQARFGAEFDIVEACDWGLLFVPPVLDATRPCVTQLHGSIGQISVHDPVAGEQAQDALTRLIERGAMGRAQAAQTYSRANAEFWRQQSERDVTMIRPAWRRRAGTPAAAINTRGLVVGRVQAWKGPQLLCEALQLLGARAPEFDWIGRDTPSGMRSRMTSETLAASFPDIWGHKIHWGAQADPDAVARAQAQALFNLVPSTWDVFNFTAVEAMASGRPVICSTGAGASELIEDGVNGFIFANGNPEALASTIERVLACSPQRMIEIGRAGQDSVAATLAPEQVAAARIEQYKKCIAEFAPRTAANDDWLDLACRPAEAGNEPDMSFLDHQPLKDILRYSARRALRKALRRP
ncbi:MAG: glycosyltransferase family 4 protein [Pseudolabrys sp.]